MSDALRALPGVCTEQEDAAVANLMQWRNGYDHIKAVIKAAAKCRRRQWGPLLPRKGPELR